MVAYVYNPSTGILKWENCREFEASLGYITMLCLKTSKQFAILALGRPRQGKQRNSRQLMQRDS